MDQPEVRTRKKVRAGGLLLRNGRHLLRDAVNGSQSCHQISAVDPDHFAVRKKGAKPIQHDGIGGGGKGWNQHGGVTDIEIGMASWIAVMRTIGTRWHGQLDDLQWRAFGILGRAKASEIVLEGRVVGVFGVGLDYGYDRAWRNKAGDIVDMSVGIVALQAIVEPNHFSNAQPPRESFFNIGPTERWIPVGVQQALLGRQQGSLSIGIQGATFQNKVVGDPRNVEHPTGGRGNHVIEIPRPVFFTPAIKNKIVRYSLGSFCVAAKDENRATIANPSIVARDRQNFKIGGANLFAGEAFLNLRSGRTIFGQEINLLAWEQGLDDVQVGFFHAFEKTRPSLGIMGPSEKSSFVFFPLCRKTVSGPIDAFAEDGCLQDRRNR